MDATLSQILLGLFTNGLSTVLEHSWETLEGEAMLSSADAVSSVIDDLMGSSALDDARHGADLREFLGSPEVTALMRSLFVVRVHGEDETTASLRAAFRVTFGRKLPELDVSYADRLFDILASGAERVLEKAARAGDPEAMQTLQASYFRFLSEELNGVRTALAELAEVPEPTVADFERWEALYRTQVQVRHGTITPPSFDAAERLPIDDIYIAPRFIAAPRPGETSTHTGRGLTAEQLASTLDRTVILGDPGAGKSTYSQKLIYDLARRATTVPGGALTPFLVTLKDYGAERQHSQLSLVDWIERVVNSDYNAEAPAGAVRYLLNAGRAMVIFDGLDELLDTSYRRDVAADVETFAARYVSAPMLVTSRQVGYAQAPLDRRRFVSVRLQELDYDQIVAYARLWFGLRHELPLRKRQAMAEDFIAESEEAADDIRRNTLMLALLCNIYRGDGYIPRRRPQVYEKCAVMLFERWDRGRRIHAPLEFERHLRPAMQHLAFWIYSHPELRGGVTERSLVRSATGFLVGRRYEDEDAARQEATRFVEFCRGRAWVFTDTGTTADGERLYQFTHRTFLEYFAAEHLVRTNRIPDDLADVLLPHIAAGEWDVVAQLAFQLQDDNLDGAADELLTRLLSISGKRERPLALSFAARSLAFLVPSRQTCREVAAAVTRQTFEYLGTPDPDRIKASVVLGDGSASATHRSLVRVDVENVEPVATGLMEEALALLEDDEPARTVQPFLEVAASCDMAFRGWTGHGTSEAQWDRARVTAFERAWPLLQTRVKKDSNLAYDAFLFGKLSVDRLLESHGTSSLFTTRRFDIYESYIRLNVMEVLLRGQLRDQVRPDGSPVGTPEELAAVGRHLAISPPPWNATGIRHVRIYESLQNADRMPVDLILGGAALFGGFATLAVTAEHATRSEGEPALLLDVLSGCGGWISVLFPWIQARLDETACAPDSSGLALDDSMRVLVDSWATRQWSCLAADPG